MLNVRRIRESEQEVRRGISSRGLNTDCIDQVLALDLKRRGLLAETESLKSQRNKVSKEIGILRGTGKDTSSIQASMRALGEQIGELDSKIREIDAKLGELMLTIPNVPHRGVPEGTDESANRTVRECGKPATFDFKPKNHVELGENLGILDFSRSARMSSSGFPLLIGQGARLQRSLIRFMLDMHVNEHGYTEVWPPVLCNSAAMTGTGQLPKLIDDMYRLPGDDLYLIPTAEVPLTNLYREEIIEKDLPIYLTAYTPCFRREAGAAGETTRGLIRVHQFDKVEMVKFVEPGTSYDELELLLTDAEDVIQRLDLVYRVRELCAGDISFAAAKCYDIELWAPGQNDWLEVSSCSNFEDFQARRAGIRYRDKKGKVRFVHTLNGSGVALPRLLVAILENFQKADGSVVLPEAIVPYMDGVELIQP